MTDNEKMRRFRKQAEALAKLVDASKSELDFVRADARLVCETCGLEYLDHPQLENILFLICDGMFVKL